VPALPVRFAQAADIFAPARLQMENVATTNSKMGIKKCREKNKCDHLYITRAVKRKIAILCAVESNLVVPESLIL
jgi:hypothetical protein